MTRPIDRGPLQTYQVIWKSGHVEEFQAHQVLLPRFAFFGEREHNRLTIHGEFDGQWRLVLDADYDDISSVRLLADAERPS